jgi:hypothetical protein
MKIYIAAVGAIIAAVVWMFATLISIPYGTSAKELRQPDIAAARVFCASGPLQVRASAIPRCIPNS